jgi:hypothetical protein
MLPTKQHLYSSLLHTDSQRSGTSGSASKYVTHPCFLKLTPITRRYKSFKLIGLHPLCAVIFTAGYALREVAAFNYFYSTRNLIIYVLSQVFIYICP